MERGGAFRQKFVPKTTPHQTISVEEAVIRACSVVNLQHPGLRPFPPPTVSKMPATSVRSGRETTGRDLHLRCPPKTGRAVGFPAPRGDAARPPTAPGASPRREIAPTWAGDPLSSRQSPRNVRTFRGQCLGTQRPRGPSAAATTTSPRGAEAGGGLRIPRGHRPLRPRASRSCALAAVSGGEGTWAPAGRRRVRRSWFLKRAVALLGDRQLSQPMAGRSPSRPASPRVR